jgi:putative aminopeptidase FrvX
MSYTPSKESLLKLLKELDGIVAPSGFEDEIREYIAGQLRDHSDEMWVDSMGNLIAVKKGGGEGKLMIAAHMDEIGLMIKHVSKDGFLKFSPIGGWAPIILPGQRVIIKGLKGGTVKGVIGSKPPHIMKPEEAKQVIPIDELFIDVGASSREEVEKLGIGIGSVAVIDRGLEVLGNDDVVTGRAFDNKVGVAVMIEFMRSLDNIPFDVYAVATVQEEVGLKGARTAAFSIGPDVGIALDTTVASDVPGVDESQHVVKLGKGPAIKIMDGRSGSGLISHPAVRTALIEAAEKERIPYQLEVLPGGTTDASAIQITKEGVPAGTISIPTRYIHSPIETLNMNDVVNAVKLLKAFTERLNKDWISKNLRIRLK